MRPLIFDMDSTIAAISTAYGEAGIGIVRMSGPRARDIAMRIFVSAKKIADFEPRHMYCGNIVDPSSDAVMDEVLLVYMKAPNTYTAEDLVEIQCHGSMLALKNILALCLREGAEMAEPGEFTKRAFVNGRMDLSQAEAVIDLIKAKSEGGFNVAVSQMQGKLSEKISSVRAELLDTLVELTVNMDYPDEDIEVLTYEKFINRLSAINDKLEVLLSSAGEGKILKEGIGVAIVGKPNVGKSSLLNIFLNENRSIVTDIPGTTRDTIEEQASVRGIPVRFIDTAGIHDSEDKVEAIGIERSKDAFNKADLVMLVLDSSSVLSDEDRTLLSLIEGRKAVVVLNKTDLAANLSSDEIETSAPVICVSAADGSGIEELKDEIERQIGSADFRRNDDVIINNIRHENLIRKASGEILEALSMAKAGEAMDFIEVNVHAAYDYLGEIIGETAGDQVINEVFSRFCLGK